MTINLLWPRWAEVVAHLYKKNVGSWPAVRRAARLLAQCFRREQDARFARLAWEELEQTRKTAARELWARPPHRIRFVRYFLGLALALCLSRIPATASPLEERDAPAGATEYSDDEQVRRPTQLDEPGRLYKTLGWAMFAGATGDFVSTEYLLSNGGSELNPLMQTRGVRIGATVAFPFAVNWMTEELRKDGHPKLALWMRVGLVGLKGYAVFHNLRAAP